MELLPFRVIRGRWVERCPKDFAFHRKASRNSKPQMLKQAAVDPANRKQTNEVHGIQPRD
jgi:hypothetical protein